jgi:hypothetical protein
MTRAYSPTGEPPPNFLGIPLIIRDDLPTGVEAVMTDREGRIVASLRDGVWRTYPNPSDTLPSVGISSPGSSTGTLM